METQVEASGLAVGAVARLAGDQFVIVLEGLNVGNEAEGVARKIIDAMAPPVVKALSVLLFTK